MNIKIPIHFCDVTGEVFSDDEELTIVEVYSVGTKHPEENEHETVLSIKKSLLPDFEGDLTMYVDSSYNIISLGDPTETWSVKHLDDDFVNSVTESLRKITSDKYNKKDEIINSVTVNNKKII